VSDPYALRTSTTGLDIPAVFLGATSLPQIGFYLYNDTTAAYELNSDKVGVRGALLRDPAQGAKFVPAITLGYTPDEIWEVTYQGFLTGLEVARPAEVEDGLPAAGQLRVALQARTPAGALTQVLRVYDPTFGIRLGDIVQLWTTATTAVSGPCPATQLSTDVEPVEPFEGQVVAIDPPDAAHPGGSLVLGQPAPLVKANGGFTVTDTTAQDYWNGANGLGNCRAALAGAPGSFTAVSVRVRARGWDPAEPDPSNHHEFVVAGASLGYLGRATQNAAADVAAGGTPRDFVLRTRDEATLPCPLVPWPTDPASVSCDDACRQRCEDLVVARKARRIWNVSVSCATDDFVCLGTFPMFDPTAGTNVFDPTLVIQPTGPVVAFRLGVDFTGKLDPKKNVKDLVRDTVIRFQSRSGFSPATRFGSAISGGTGIQPFGGVPFDRSADPTWNKLQDGARLYVPYLGGTLVDASPSHSNGTTTQLR
jgi:hypothetical protein